MREQASLYSVLLAAFARAVGQYAQHTTAVVIAPVSRRTDLSMQPIIGPFMNTVPMLIDLEPAHDLTALVREVKTTVREALSNRDAPWQDVLTALKEQHGLSALGIGQIAFLMDDPAPAEVAIGGFTLTRVPNESIVIRREMTVAMSTSDGQITGNLTYDGSLFEERSVERIVASFIAGLTVSHSERG